MDLRTQAEEVSTDLQRAGILIEALTLVELVYYCFELYKECHPDPKSAKYYLQSEYDGTEFSNRVMRPAVRQVRRAAREKQIDMSDDDMEKVATATLLKAMNADDAVVTACYSS